MGRLKHEISLFCKAQLTAFGATVIDFSVSVLLVEMLGWWYVTATGLGALTGGVINCVLNYKWVFEVRGLKKCSVALRYLLVWTGSIALNTVGTYVLTELSGRYFALTKAVVAVGVAVLWNYQLQRRYVYRTGRGASWQHSGV